jgi:hypothetical protein
VVRLTPAGSELGRFRSLLLAGLLGREESRHRRTAYGTRAFGHRATFRCLPDSAALDVSFRSTLDTIAFEIHFESPFICLRAPRLWSRPTGSVRLNRSGRRTQRGTLRWTGSAFQARNASPCGFPVLSVNPTPHYTRKSPFCQLWGEKIDIDNNRRFGSEIMPRSVPCPARPLRSLRSSSRWMKRWKDGKAFQLTSHGKDEHVMFHLPINRCLRSQPGLLPG